MSAIKTYRKAVEQAHHRTVAAEEAQAAFAQAKQLLLDELDLQHRRALRLSALLSNARRVADGGPAEDVPNDDITRFCEPTLNHYGFALVDHPTKRNYLTRAFKEQA